MIQYYTYLTKDEDCCVYRSINDKKKYRFLKLENGLKVIIIQDVRKANGGDQCSEEQAIKRMRLDEGSKTTAPDSSSSQAADSANANGADRLAAVALTVSARSLTLREPGECALSKLLSIHGVISLSNCHRSSLSCS